MNSKVSIVVPIYNTAKYLEKCLDSIINQSYQNLEIILINDGSTDNSGKIAEKYAKKDPRIVVIHQKNQGQSTARNIGLKRASGDFIGFIDGDDEITPDFIEKLVNATSENTSLTVCGMLYKRLKQKTAESVYLTPLRARRPQESLKAYLLYLLAVDGRMYSSVNKIYRLKWARNIIFNDKSDFAEDTHFVLNYLKKAEGEIKFVNEPLYIYNFGTETSTINKTATNWQNWQTSYEFLKSWVGKTPSPSELFWLRLVHLRWRISYLRSKRRAKSSR